MNCACGKSLNAPVHSRHYREADGHEFADPRRPGLQPISEGMKAFRRKSGYDAAVRAAKGKPCAIGSPVCTGAAQHLHEPLGRGVAGGLKAALRDGPPPIEACNRCNSYVAEHREWAEARGFLVKRKGGKDARSTATER